MRSVLECNTLQVVADLEVDGVRAVGVTYAFYLLVDGKRMAVRWYSPLNETVFDVAGITGLVEIVAFSKDMFGDKLIRRHRA